MLKETFRHFVEIMSLKSKILEYERNIKSEEKRISDLQAKRHLTDDKILKLNEEIVQLNIKELEYKIDSLTSRLSKLKNQVSSVVSEKELSAINHEITHSQNELNLLETAYFSNLEKAEKHSVEILDLKQFLIGSLETLNEISVEVKISVNKNQHEIKNLQLRITSLLEQLSSSDRHLFLDTDKKFKDKIPCSFINLKNCSECKISIDSQTINNVEKFISVELCPNCGRILLSKFM
jgi:predicted  nucleic acid-binding Zn-ribbon protein